MFILILIYLIFIITFIKLTDKYFYILAGCKRIRVIGGQNNLNKFLYIIPGTTMFGNNFDFKATTTFGNFKIHRELVKKSKYQNYVRYLIKKPCVNIVNPEEAEFILNNKELIKKGVVYTILHPFLNQGILTSSGEKWLKRRKFIIPALNFKILKNKIINIFKKETNILLENLKITNEDSKIISLFELFTKFSLNCVVESAFGVEIGNTKERDEYLKNVHQHEQNISYDIFSGITYFPMLAKIKNYYVKKSHIVSCLHNFTKEIINQCRKNKTNFNENFQLCESKEYPTLLDNLLKIEAEGMINDEGIQEEVNTFIFGAYDTTSGALTFNLLLLSHYQDIQEKCLEEILSVTNNPSNLTINECNNLKYLDCVIKETLRLYPSAPSIGRECINDTILGNLLLPKGTNIHIDIYDIHHNPKHYKDPDTFNPDRFLPENSINRHPYAFIPFSAGSRSCIGQKYALLQMKIMLANFIKEFKVLPVTKIENLELGSGLLLKPKEGIQIKIIKRVI